MFGRRTQQVARFNKQWGSSVALSSIAQPAHETIRGVKFAMRDGGMLVPVLVMHAALQVIEWSPPGSSDYLARFKKHRDRLERIADKKHLRGQIEGDGSIIVLRSDVQVAS